MDLRDASASKNTTLSTWCRVSQSYPARPWNRNPHCPMGWGRERRLSPDFMRWFNLFFVKFNCSVNFLKKDCHLLNCDRVHLLRLLLHLGLIVKVVLDVMSYAPWDQQAAKREAKQASHFCRVSSRFWNWFFLNMGWDEIGYTIGYGVFNQALTKSLDLKKIPRGNYQFFSLPSWRIEFPFLDVFLIFKICHRHRLWNYRILSCISTTVLIPSEWCNTGTEQNEKLEILILGSRQKTR